MHRQVGNAAGMLRGAIARQDQEHAVKGSAAGMLRAAMAPAPVDDSDDEVAQLRARVDEINRRHAEPPKPTADILRETIQGGNGQHIPLNGAGVLRAMLRGIGGNGTINGV
ncbi:hypothetical protein [Nocardia sp. NPDC003354]